MGRHPSVAKDFFAHYPLTSIMNSRSAAVLYRYPGVMGRMQRDLEADANVSEILGFASSSLLEMLALAVSSLENDRWCEDCLKDPVGDSCYFQAFCACAEPACQTAEHQA